MKTNVLFTTIFAFVFALIVEPINLFAQKLEASSVTPLTKSSKKAQKAVLSFDKDAKTLQMIFASPKGKNATLFDVYNFDWELKLTNQATEEVTEEQATAKMIKAISSTRVKTQYDANRQLKQVKTKYYKVIAGGGLLNTKVQTGSYTATEIFSEELGDYYWDVTTGEGQEVKIQADERRISGEFAMADQPIDFVKEGLWKWDNDAKYFAPQSMLTVVGVLQPKVQKTKGTKIVDNQDYILKTFDVKNGLTPMGEHIVKFTGPKIIVQKLQYPDGSMGVLFAPHNRVSQLGFDKTILYKPNEYTYMHFGIDGKTIDSIAFDCPANSWKPEYYEFNNGSLLLAGGGSKTDPEKYHWELINGAKDQFIIMKITNGKLDFITSTLVATFSSKMVKPASQKEGFAFVGADFANVEFRTHKSGDLLMVGQIIKGGKPLDFMLLQFDASGNLKAQYDIKNENPFAGDVRLFDNPDGKTITWMITESRKVIPETKRKFQYVRIATIDPAAITISDVSNYGTRTKEQKTEFYLNPVTPMILLDQEVILIGSDEDNENIWLAKVAFGVN